MTKDIELRIREAKKSMSSAEDLIRDYIPFIKSQGLKASNKSLTESDDEYSIGMIAFYEAIQSYNENKGSFISYASVIIKNRLIDYYRSQKRHDQVESLDREIFDEDSGSLMDTIQDERDHYQEFDLQSDLKKEILLLTEELKDFDIILTEIAENMPKQDRTLKSCRDICN